LKFKPDIFPTCMDKFWSILTMPIGVALCFGPALLVWWLSRDKKPRENEREQSR
jgi:hypothetical protein